MSYRLRSVALALTLLATAGCAYKPRALPVRLVDEYPNVVVHQDVRVAADPFDDTTSKRILNEAVNSKGYVSVLIGMENKGDERVVIDAANIDLEASGGQVYQRTASDAVAKNCHKSVGLHVILFGWLSGIGAADYNREMTEDWKAKELPSQVVLEPHSSRSGLLFYTIDDFSNVHGATLTMPVAIGSRDYEEVRCVLP